MEHVPAWHARLSQANTALRDGGLLVVAIPNLRYWKALRRLLRGRGRGPEWAKGISSPGDGQNVGGSAPARSIQAGQSA